MSDAFFSAYDRWNGLIPFFGGIYATMLAYGYLPRTPKDPEKHALWLRKFGPMMRIVGPVVILTGAITLVIGLTKEDPITQTIRELNAAPKMVDQITRFDRATAGPGQRLTIEQTIITVRATDIPKAVWDKFAPQFRKNISNSKIGRLPSKGITVVYRYFGNDGKLVGEFIIPPQDSKK